MFRLLEAPLQAWPAGYRLGPGRCQEIDPALAAIKGDLLAKPNYQFEKRQRDLAKKRKQEEKRLQKLAQKAASDGAASASGEPEDPVGNNANPDQPDGEGASQG